MPESFSSSILFPLGQFSYKEEECFLLSNSFGDTKFIVLGGLSSWILYKVLIIAFFIIPYSYVLYNKVVWKISK